MVVEYCQVICKCNKKLEKRLLKKYEEIECFLWFVVCQYCDLEFFIFKLKEYEDYCGVWMELCGNCGCNVFVKDLKIYFEVCGREGEEKRNEVVIFFNVYDEFWGQDGIWIVF